MYGILSGFPTLLTPSLSHTHNTLRHTQTSEKTYKLCGHAACNVAGLTADANILIDQARIKAGRFFLLLPRTDSLRNIWSNMCVQLQTSVYAISWL
jgi:20S proteasome subunit alpha 3